jgi:hypothetical protein
MEVTYALGVAAAVVALASTGMLFSVRDGEFGTSASPCP